MNDQKAGTKYKQGQTLSCVVLDIDPVKNIADLSEKLLCVKTKDHEVKVGKTYKALVELNKESYLILSIKNNRKKLGICILQNFNQDDQPEQM